VDTPEVDGERLMPTLRVMADRLGPVQEVADYLRAMENAYNHLCAFALIIDDAKARYEEPGYRWSRTKKVRSIRSITHADTVVLPEDRLTLLSVRVESPGFWDFVGKLNPLEVLRQYLSDRHERIKDKSYRNDLERERLRLENERLKTKVVEDRANLLRDFGVPEDKIRQALVRHLVEPLAQLDKAQDKQLIGAAEIVEARGELETN
jgi:hypothetical protein